ncbi:olfactory receptor 8H3-like [Dasypus novemcinctus]|uniref:olfactory receptor 8H3-like n=1 Tax=Dasypus novemcinctus TaxID=9361 RepID=UPI000328C2DD|nr:olfactory receptor 8H3-like [Dasypus novemcinctus]
MAYDRYVAICNPLHYKAVMSRKLCYAFITVSYMIGFTQSLAIVLCISSLHFCKSHVAYHFFCDTTPVLVLSCTDTHGTEIMIINLVVLNIMGSLSTITVSYVSILSNILKINSTSGKRKAVSTCASHLMGVTIFYSTMIFTYLKLKKSYSLGRDQVASVFYTMVIPMLNPLIYTFRNKEVNNALIRVMQKIEASRQF